MSTLLIRGGSIVTADGLTLADVLVKDGKIEKIGLGLSSEKHAETIEAEGMLLFPGLIDCHVHFREPGFERKATMETEARSARAGGVTTVCEMPNTSPPTTTIAALADKVRRAEKVSTVDIRFFFGVTQAEHLHALVELWTGSSAELKRLKKHCCGVKLYLDHSTGNQKVDSEIVEDIFAACTKHAIPLVAHCEDPQINATAAAKNKSSDVSAHSLMRPPEAEVASIEYALELVRKHGAALHVAHLSTKQGIELVRKAKKEGLPITCEVAPHHLFLTVDDYSTLGALAKMNPPVRTSDHRDALWKGVIDGTVDCIATDHAPHTLEEKNNAEPLKAPSGVPGVETMLPLLLSVAAGYWPEGIGNQVSKSREAIGFSVQKLFELCFTNPNRIFSLGKKEIIKGAKVSIVIVNPAKEWTIHANDLHSKCEWTPFELWSVKGKVVDVV